MELLSTVFTICFLYQLSFKSCTGADSGDSTSLETLNQDVSAEENDAETGNHQSHLSKTKDKEVNEKTKSTFIDEIKKKENEQYQAEKEAGDPADMLGVNVHYNYPAVFKDFGRRFVLQYPYTEINGPGKAKDKVKNEGHELIPVKASPEEVLKVAIQSAIDQALKPENKTDETAQKEMLRTGDYWNSVWVEEVDPKTVLRSYSKTSHLETANNNDVKLSSVNAKIMPGSKLYQLVSVLKQFSPRLLYVINNRK